MKQKSGSELKNNIFLICFVVAIVVLPFWLFKGHDFSGTDDRASAVIKEIDKDYEPWFKPLWRPPNKDIESMLFALQAAIGAGFIGFYIGLSVGKSKK